MGWFVCYEGSLENVLWGPWGVPNPTKFGLHDWHDIKQPNILTKTILGLWCLHHLLIEYSVHIPFYMQCHIIGLTAQRWFIKVLKNLVENLRGYSEGPDSQILVTHGTEWKTSLKKGCVWERVGLGGYPPNKSFHFHLQSCKIFV